MPLETLNPETFYVPAAPAMQCPETYDQGVRVLPFNSSIDTLSAGTESHMRRLLVRMGPLMVAIKGSGVLQRYTDGIISGDQCNWFAVDHAVLLVGFTADYHKFQNSWGTSWGEDGYFRTTRDHAGTCLGVGTWADSCNADYEDSSHFVAKQPAPAEEFPEFSLRDCDTNAEYASAHTRKIAASIAFSIAVNRFV